MRQFYGFLFSLLLGQSAILRAQTITSFSPASGNVGTLVTLSGSNLNLVSAVAINGAACLPLDKTNTSLRLLVMPGATSGPITTTSGTATTSAALFTLTRSGTTWTQQGAKLVGTGSVGTSRLRGGAVALSADGNTLAVGGSDDDAVGATWIFSTPSSPLANRSAAKSSASPSFFPNPVADRLTISGAAASAGMLRLFDSLGRSLFTSTYQDGKPLDLSKLPAGLYWLQIDQAPAQALLKY